MDDIRLNIVEHGDWVLEIGGPMGIVYRPHKSTKIPNAFQRWMIKKCLSMHWIYKPEK
jgi:hypothetical protein